MDVPGSPAVAEAMSARAPLLFLSAHLDDAVLSCGGLMTALVGRCPLTVATIFTHASRPPHTTAARSFLRQCSAPDAETLFTRRRSEDRAVLDDLGARHLHLGATDALFRTRDCPAALARLARAVPELVHRYPTYRFDIAKGRVSRGDRTLATALARRVSGLLEETGARLVFCPVGVGDHVDHLITRSVGECQARRVVYYSDFPYNLAAAPDRAFLARHHLEPWTWDWTDGKDRLVRGYHTQVDALFPDGVIPTRPETYYEPPAMSSA